MQAHPLALRCWRLQSARRSSRIESMRLGRATILCLLCIAASHAQSTVQAKHANLELLSTPVTEGRGDILLGVHFTLEKGWHIYWINPGDSGQPPSFKWILPPG